jgi:hypothetical protein
MLEVRKLSLELERDANGRFWTSLSLGVWTLAVLLLVSVWLGLAIEPEPANHAQEKMSQEHTQLLSLLEQTKSALATDQDVLALSPLQATIDPLLAFAQSVSVATQADKDSRDPAVWSGRANLIADDFNALVQGKDTLAHYQQLKTDLALVFKPKGPINHANFAPTSAAKEFHAAALEWAKQGASPEASATKLSWGMLQGGKAAWRQLNAQLDALETEAKLVDDKAQALPQAKAAQALLAAMAKADLLDAVRTTDEALPKILQAFERLQTSLDNLPSEPQVILPPAQFSWRQLAYPGTTLEGLNACLAMMLMGGALLVAAQLARRHHMKLLSVRFVQVAKQLEAAVRSMDGPLAQAVSKLDVLSADFVPMLDKLHDMQQAQQTPSDTPHKTLEEQAWATAVRMQQDLEADLSMLRDKLLNIHLQFCSGQPQENLVYDLAFTTEGLQTILLNAKDLARSFAMLKESLSPESISGPNPDLAVLISQASILRSGSKRIGQTLQELSAQLQLAVEDVPEGQRPAMNSLRSQVGSYRGHA